MDKSAELGIPCITKVFLCSSMQFQCHIEASPSKRILLGPFSSPWLLGVTILLSLASTEHLL
uniref:Lhy2 n=1 Tax=Rhizophora mucronata TaxID=61149 RepID=A0A2P2JUY9_RHIMU